MQVPEIENVEIVTDVFGGWPSYHDAEIVRLTLDRSGPEGPRLEALIYVFLMTTDVDKDGFYILKHKSLVTLEFTEVAVEKIECFNQQNVISAIVIVDIDPAKNDGRRFEIEFGASYGCEATFQAKRIIVRDLIPYREDEWTQTRRRGRPEPPLS